MSKKNKLEPNKADQSSFTKIFFMMWSIPTTNVVPATKPTPKIARATFAALKPSYRTHILYSYGRRYGKIQETVRL
mgnify:CR=1 FL=1